MMPKKAHLEKHASMGAECQLSDKDSQLLCGQICHTLDRKTGQYKLQ